jgi:PIN domain nuclease of toxin-antitoxin system
VLLDTHAAIWHLLKSRKLSRAASAAIEKRIRRGLPIYISAVSIVEATYLAERNRISLDALNLLESALKDPSSGMVVAPLDLATASAVGRVPRDAVPELADRIIAATALQLDVPLVTRDARIQASGIRTIW